MPNRKAYQVFVRRNDEWCFAQEFPNFPAAWEFARQRCDDYDGARIVQVLSTCLWQSGGPYE